MTDLKEFILKRSAELNSEITRFRRHFHMNPELAYEEFKTAEFICKFLDDNGISYRNGIAGTGIVAEIPGNNPGKFTIGLRAEMDALPVTELNNTPYKSLNSGIMHACGHDAHMAMLMGTALMLNSLKDHFGGKFLLIFQPGEELAPGGAKLMIETGIFNELKPDIVLAQHVLPELETGKVGYRAGRYMASSDEIYITVKGKGGHAALPGLSTDQIYIASTLIVRLKDSISRAKEENKIPTVLGIGRIRGDGATNVIPETVEIAGTFRTFDENWRKEAKNMIKEISASVADEFRVTIDVNIVHGYPVLFNNEKLAGKAVKLSSELFGSDKTEMFDLRMSSEDFAFFTEVFPSLYFRVGIKRKGENMKMLHTPLFDIDENGLSTGMANMTWLALNFINENDLP
jgi:amidohydrolase